jgi:hypothetical protein
VFWVGWGCSSGRAVKMPPRISDAALRFDCLLPSLRRPSRLERGRQADAVCAQETPRLLPVSSSLCQFSLSLNTSVPVRLLRRRSVTARLNAAMQFDASVRREQVEGLCNGLASFELSRLSASTRMHEILFAMPILILVQQRAFDIFTIRSMEATGISGLATCCCGGASLFHTKHPRLQLGLFLIADKVLSNTPVSHVVAQEAKLLAAIMHC